MTNVLIIGGGIAGPVTALALRKAGIDSIVYEAYPTGADDVGAFLTIMHNGMDALQAVDAHEPVIDNSFPAHTIELFNSAGKQIEHRPIGAGIVGVTGPRTLKRATLYRVLHDELARRGVRIEHSKRLIEATITSGDRVTASFADGAQAQADILIGADGIHSATRTIIDPTAPQPRFTGLYRTYGYTTSTSTSTPAARDAYRMIQGKRAFFGYTTSPDGETYWFARLRGTELSKTELAAITPDQWKQRTIEVFAEDNTPAADIIRATGEDIVGGNTYDVPSTPMWHNKSMVLVGDAAHAASPAAGQGASMALEDSVILAKCLRDVSDKHQAFTTYEHLRRERVERLVAASAAQDNGIRPGYLRRLLRDLLPSRTLLPRPESRTWLYDHHIDWSRNVTLGLPGGSTLS
ncbi:MAG: FAD-dependent monooxygenase [Pseudonocardia sp.]|nr:FAD-dependent monooxygenase [Pseudonocardia sp.]